MANPRASLIIPAVEAFVCFIVIILGLYSVSCCFGKFVLAPFEAAPSPERAIAILEILRIKNLLYLILSVMICCHEGG